MTPRPLQLALRSEALRLMADAGLSLRQLAPRIGVSHSTLCVWLSERGNPTIASWSRVFYALGCEVDVRAVRRMGRAA